MKDSEADHINDLAQQLLEFRGQLLSLAKRNLNPILLNRVSPEDVVQDTIADACRKNAYFEANPEIPTYFKLRTLLFQTITALERKHLQCQKRDAYKECAENHDVMNDSWGMFADTITGPFTKYERVERYALLRKALAELPENDRQILELRHFDDMSNSECAQVLHITPKNASIRYVRALERLQKSLSTLTGFGNA